MKKSNDLFSAMHDKMTPSQEVIERLYARAEAEIQSDNSDSKPSESMNGGIIMNKRDIDELAEKTIEHPSRRGAFAASAAALILVFGIGATVVMGGGLNKGAGSGEVPISESVPESVTDDVKETTVSFKAPDTWAAVTEEMDKSEILIHNEEEAFNSVFDLIGRSEKQLAAHSVSAEMLEPPGSSVPADGYAVSLVFKSGEHYDCFITDKAEIIRNDYQLNGKHYEITMDETRASPFLEKLTLREQDLRSVSCMLGEVPKIGADNTTIGGYRFDITTKFRKYDCFITFDGSQMETRELDITDTALNTNEITIGFTENEPYSYTITDPDTIAAITEQLRKVEKNKNNYIFNKVYEPHGGSNGYIIKADGDAYEAMYFIEHIEGEPNLTICGVKYDLPSETITALDDIIAPTVPKGHKLPGTKAEIVITEDEAVTTALNDRGVTPDDLQKTDFGNIGEPRLTDVQFSTAEDGTPVYTVKFCLYEENAQKTKKLLNTYEYKINAADGLPMEKNVSPRKINSNDAMEIALADRGVTREEVVEANKEKETVSISAGIGKLSDGTPVINVTFGYPKQNEDGSSTYYNCDYTIAALGGEIINKKIVTDDSAEKTGLITENEAAMIALNDCGITLEDLHETDFGMIGETRKTDVKLVTLDDGTPAYIVTFNILDNDPERTYSVEYIHTYTINAEDGTIIDKKSEGYV